MPLAMTTRSYWPGGSDVGTRMDAVCGVDPVAMPMDEKSKVRAYVTLFEPCFLNLASG